MYVVVIPAYKPDETLIKLSEELKANDFSILVVDDGSGEKFKEIFDEVSFSARVIHHAENMGKGSALKTGFANIKSLFPECTHFITADADGQHKVEDIIRVRDALEGGAKMVLTVRDLGKNIPFRSKFGNDLSRRVYTVMTGHWLKDNQSGLRGFGVENIDWLLKVGGSKYDYEMNMLYYADKQKIEMTTLPIKAIYIDGNKSSHFNPVKDTIRIYKRLFKSAAAPIIIGAIAEATLITLCILLGYRQFFIALPTVGIVGAIARLLIDQFIIFNGIAMKTGMQSLFGTVFRYIIYLAACLLTYVAKIKIPLIIIINVIALILIPIKYFICKGIAKRREKKAEKALA